MKKISIIKEFDFEYEITPTRVVKDCHDRTPVEVSEHHQQRYGRTLPKWDELIVEAIKSSLGKKDLLVPHSIKHHIDSEYDYQYVLTLKDYFHQWDNFLATGVKAHVVMTITVEFDICRTKKEQRAKRVKYFEKDRLFEKFFAQDL